MPYDVDREAAGKLDPCYVYHHIVVVICKKILYESIRINRKMMSLVVAKKATAYMILSTSFAHERLPEIFYYQ